MMSSPLDLAWLIPSLPLMGSLFVGLLLVSFSRTMNRLTKPVSYLLIVCVLASVILSFILYQSHVSGDVYYDQFPLVDLNRQLGLHVDNVVTTFLLIFGLAVVSLMGYLLFFTTRQKGYVRNMVIIGALCASGFYFIMSGNPFQMLIAKTGILPFFT